MPQLPSTFAKAQQAFRDPAPAGYTEEGNASWYGVPFHGRRASNGEIYDMYKLTAAHRTLPFETMVRVTNLNNGKSTVVRITDRGPFVENRIIDLSLAAAREIESVGPGVVPVRVEVLSPGIDPTAGFFTVQVGAFRDRYNAERLRDRLERFRTRRFSFSSTIRLTAFYYRVRVGKVSGEDAARQFGEQLRDREGFTPMVVRLDEGTPAGGNQMSADCLFCKIAAKQIPSKIVYEDPDIFAFEDISPQAPTHILICPRKHFDSLDDAHARRSSDARQAAAGCRAASPRTQSARGLSHRLQQRRWRRPVRLSSSSAPARWTPFPLAAGVVGMQAREPARVQWIV